MRLAPGSTFSGAIRARSASLANIRPGAGHGLQIGDRIADKEVGRAAGFGKALFG
ncbi:MAG: hypothetical protein IPL18_15065 [Sphingomonadales bacterium]|nr:hypothetical protein [Sphingomonadales bacterium]